MHAEPVSCLGSENIEDMQQFGNYSRKELIIVQVKARVANVEIDEGHVKLGEATLINFLMEVSSKFHVAYFYCAVPRLVNNPSVAPIVVSRVHFKAF